MEIPEEIEILLLVKGKQMEAPTDGRWLRSLSHRLAIETLTRMVKDKPNSSVKS